MLTGPNVDWGEIKLDGGADRRACTCWRHARPPGLAGAALPSSSSSHPASTAAVVQTDYCIDH
jgi:hypothetical protein